MSTKSLRDLQSYSRGFELGQSAYAAGKDDTLPKCLKKGSVGARGFACGYEVATENEDARFAADEWTIPLVAEGN